MLGASDFEPQKLMHNFTLMVLILPYVAVAFDDYTPETFPDSIEQPFACGMLTPGFLCDPSNVLGKGNHVANNHQLTAALQKVQEATNCSCSSMDRGHCDDARRGFTISVAVTRRMVLEENQRNSPSSTSVAAETFADILRKRQHRGQCDDDVLIFISAEDHVVWTSIGSVARRYLTDAAVDAVTSMADSHFSKGDYTEGIQRMVDSYTALLKGEDLDLNSSWNWPIPLWLVIAIGALLFLVLLTLNAFMVYRCVLYCKGDRRAKYTMGTRL